MPEARKRRRTRLAVARRAGNRCEYCLSPDNCSPAPFVVEHISPTARGGEDSQDNFAWACGGCNGHKAAATGAKDIVGNSIPLFHPRRDEWEMHFAWSEDKLNITGLTAIGHATILRLHLNRAELIVLRGLLKLAEKHPPPNQ